MRTLVAIVFAALPWLVAVPQDPAPDPAMLLRAQQLAATAPQHQRLARLVGDWDVGVVTTPPGGPEHRDRGRASVRPILGGRYVVANLTLPVPGGRLEAVQILGFDTLRQLYTASWRDDASTWSVEASGSPQPAAPEVLLLRGTVADARDPTGRPFRLRLDLGAADRIVVELHDAVAGQEVLVQTQHWQRD